MLTCYDLRLAVDPYGDHTFANDLGRGRFRIDGSWISSVSAAQIKPLKESAFPNSEARRSTTILGNKELRVISGDPSRGVFQHAQKIDLSPFVYVGNEGRVRNF